MAAERSGRLLVPGSFQTPNWYADELMHLLTPEEWMVLSYAVRRIFGFGKEDDRISQRQFREGTVSIRGVPLDRGTGLSKATIGAALTELDRFRVLVRTAENDPRTKQGDAYRLERDRSQIAWGLLQ